MEDADGSAEATERRGWTGRHQATPPARSHRREPKPMPAATASHDQPVKGDRKVREHEPERSERDRAVPSRGGNQPPARGARSRSGSRDRERGDGHAGPVMKADGGSDASRAGARYVR